MRTFLKLAVLAAFALADTGSANAAFVFEFQEIGISVVATGVGTIDPGNLRARLRRIPLADLA